MLSKININDKVKVTLTAAGIARVQEYIIGLGFTGKTKCELIDSMLNQESWHLHELMLVFGPLLFMGSTKLPFVNNTIEIIE